MPNNSFLHELRKNNLVYLLIISGSLLSYTYGQTNSNLIIGKAGNSIITLEEFRKRYEFTPHIQTIDAIDSSSFKINFLYTLLAEKLLAQAALADGIDKQNKISSVIENLTNVYLRDALYKKEVLDKIVIPDSEFVQGKQRALKSIKTKFIFSQKENEIQKIYLELKNGSSFDSILALQQENSEQTEAKEITFGEMNEKMENEIYKIGIGEFTVPVMLKEGWYICKVYSSNTISYLDDNALLKIEKILKSRIEDKTYQSFYKKFFRGIVINADRETVEKLHSALMFYINSREVVKFRGNVFKIGEEDIPTIKNKFNSEELDKPIIKFVKDPISLSKFLNYMSFQDLEFNSPDSAHIFNRLNAYISLYIQNTLLAREAMERGYDKLPDVSSELNIWKDYYLSQEMMKNIFNREVVSDIDAYKFFVKTNRMVQQPDQFKIAEILTDNLDKIYLILKELERGVEFNELVQKYSINDSLKNKSGESGYFKILEKGEIGKAVSKMKVGEVYGPIKTPEGYSVIKLLDKKVGKKEKVATFEEAKEDIKNILKTEKMYKNLDEITAQLALDNGVEINEHLLNSLKVSSINMLVIRRFGFGSQFLAVPFMSNFSTWFKKYQSLKKKSIL
jgi:parvulin-like peptidyl-prolyl isomerase